MLRGSRWRAIVAFLGLVAVLGVAGCGGGGGELSNRQAAELQQLVDEIRSAVENGACDDAAADASNLSVGISSLDDVPDDVVTALDAAAVRLTSLITSECGATEEPTTTSTTTTSTTTSTTTTTTETEPEEEEEEPEETTTTTTPEDPTGGVGSGGSPAPDGEGDE